MLASSDRGGSHSKMLFDSRVQSGWSADTRGGNEGWYSALSVTAERNALKMLRLHFATRRLRTGGESGIRTRGGLLTLTRFPGVRLKPLIHLSGGRQFNAASLRSCRGSWP